MNNICLINIISAQNMPNFIPVLVLKPQKVVNIIGGYPSSHHRLKLAIEKLLGKGCTVECKNADSESPDTKEMESIIMDILSKNTKDFCYIVNISGGTKPMSFGAMIGAMKSKLSNGAIIYVEKNRIQYLCTFGDNVKRIGEDSFADEIKNIPNLLDLIVLANNGSTLNRGKSWKRYVHAAELLFKYFSKERKPIAPEKDDEKDPYCAVFLEKLNEIQPEIVKAMCESGLAQQSSDGKYLSYMDNLNPRIADVKQFYQGMWWEVYVASRISKSGLFRDICWSAVSNNMEEDIIALQEGSVVPFIFSMKRSFSYERLLPHLYEFEGRANSIGSVMSKKLLCVFNFNAYAKNRENFERAAAALGIDVIKGREVEELKYPDNRWCWE